MFPPLPSQPTLTLEKDGISQERPSRPSRHPKKKAKPSAEAELSESDEYVDFAESRHEPMTEFNTVIVGDETETSSAVQSIQQVHLCIYTASLPNSFLWKVIHLVNGGDVQGVALTQLPLWCLVALR